MKKKDSGKLEGVAEARKVVLKVIVLEVDMFQKFMMPWEIPKGLAAKLPSTPDFVYSFGWNCIQKSQSDPFRD